MQEIWGQSLGQEDPLEEEMEIHFNFLDWEIPMDRGAWWATVHGVAKQSDMTEWVSTYVNVTEHIRECDWAHMWMCLVVQSCLTLWPHGLHSARFLCPWRFSKQEYWSGLPCLTPDKHIYVCVCTYTYISPPPFSFYMFLKSEIPFGCCMSEFSCPVRLSM